MLALFKRDAEYDTRNVDDGSEQSIFAKTRVLEGGTAGETTAAYRDGGKERRKAGSLGLRKMEDSVWGRR
jgi:hypothetical protein